MRLSLPKKLMYAHYLKRQRTNFSIARQAFTINKVKINILGLEDKGTSVAWKIPLGKTTPFQQSWANKVSLFIKLNHLCKSVVYKFTTATPKRQWLLDFGTKNQGQLACDNLMNEVCFFVTRPFQLMFSAPKGCSENQQTKTNNMTSHIDSPR